MKQIIQTLRTNALSCIKTQNFCLFLLPFLMMVNNNSTTPHANPEENSLRFRTSQPLVLSKKKSPSCSLSTASLAVRTEVFTPENCSNGVDDDGDGFVDAADPDCGCAETIMLAARDNGQILRINLATGGTTSVATSSPYVSGNLNALAANADNSLVYYCSGKVVYYWVPGSSEHGVVVDLTGKIGASESLSSGGGEYYNGHLYLGTENGNPGTNPKIWRQQLSASGKSYVGNPVNLNVPIPTSLSWGDIIATGEGGHTVLYCMAAASKSHFFKYNVNTATYTTIRTNLPTEMQLGVDIDGNTWAGSLSSGLVQKINRTTGYFYGNVVSFGGNVWDLTGPINCPQAVEVCGNTMDDDGDGFVDNQDQDCLCPTITANDATVRTICEGETVVFNATSNAPNPPYSYIEYYRFATPQTNPYTSSDPKTWLGEYANTPGVSGTVSSDNFPNNTSSNLTYYVYGCVKPEPQFPATCAPQVEYTITVKPSPALSVSNNVAICGGTSTGISATANSAPAPITYAWSHGLGSGALKTVNPTATTIYTVTATASNGCTASGQVQVSVNPTPVVDAGSNAAICNGTSTNLNASATGGVGPYTFQWSHGLGSGAAKTVSPTTTANYTVSVTGANGCVGTDQVSISVNSCTEFCTNGLDDDGDGLVDCADSHCSVNVEVDNAYFCICQGDQAAFSVSATGGSGVYTYAWDNGIGTGSTKTVSPTITTSYTVTVTATSGCTATSQVQVVIVACPEDCENGIDDDFDGFADCADSDCALVAAPALTNDTYSACPGTTLVERVTYNDGNLQNPAFSIAAQPAFGIVSIDATGKFTYLPNFLTCGADAFQYQVCNSATGCCSQALVTINFSDNTPPTLTNLPADLTIGCDEVVPDPTQVFAFDECPGIYIDFEEVTGEFTAGGCGTYSITRTWTASDLCGNEVTGQQVITVQDLVAPELFRVYDLPNGQKMFAGVAHLTSDNWKYVPFPVTLSSVPVVLSQCTSANGPNTVAVFQRNVSTQGFELRLTEQEGNPAGREPESVSWVAIQTGISDTLGFDLEAGTLPNVTSALSTLNFGLGFLEAPAFFAAPQTTNQADPFNLRQQSLALGGVQVYLDEEGAKDPETTHGNESIGYLAVSPGAVLLDENGDLIGETGMLNLTNAWAKVPLTKQYTNPVVILGAISMNDADPVVSLVKDVADSSFMARLKEWDYQNGTHGVEQVAYMVVEGGIPAGVGYYCAGKATNLVLGQNLFILDNCDNQAAAAFGEVDTLTATGLITTRNWSSADDCGNLVLTSRTDTCSVAAVRLRAVLHGAYTNSGGTGLMRDDLRTRNFLPNVEPFSNLNGFLHKARGGGEVVSSGLLEVVGNDAVVDWVFVEIRDARATDEVLATQSALVQRDGDVVNVYGNEVLYFPTLPEGNYVVALRHRNHLGIITDAPLFLNSIEPPLSDFTDMGLSVLGWVEAGKLLDSKRMLWAGDLNGDRSVIYQGPNNDIFYLFSRVMSDPGNATNLANFISKGYDRNDFNLDGNIIYQGPNNERAAVLYHTVLSHPGNFALLANFIARERLP